MYTAFNHLTDVTSRNIWRIKAKLRLPPYLHYIKTPLSIRSINQSIKFKFKRDCSARYVHRCSSQHTQDNGTSPLIDILSMKRCDSFLLLGDYLSLQFFHHVKFTSVIDSLLKATQTGLRLDYNRVCLGATWDLRQTWTYFCRDLDSSSASEPSG